MKINAKESIIGGLAPDFFYPTLLCVYQTQLCTIIYNAKSLPLYVTFLDLTF